MAAKKMKKSVTVEIDFDVLEKLIEAADALSEAASASIIKHEDPRVRALAKRKKKTRR
jgi:hypothetical protein